MENPLEADSLVSCPLCGEGNERGNRFCVTCGNSLARKRKGWSRNRYFLYGMIALVLTGSSGLILMRSAESKLVGRVNGEGITREEFSKRVERAKKFYEYRYGENLFQGEAGKENLNRIKADILDEMTTERILLQEARSAGYTSAPETEVEEQVAVIKKKNSLSDADLEKMFGGSLSDLRAELRNGWVISQFVEKVVLKGNQANGNQLFGQWLTNVKAKAKIEAYEKLEPVSTAKASCCGSGGGGCGGGGRTQALDPKVEQEARTKGLEYYEKKTQKKGADAKVTDFGCHIQVDIIENGKVVVSLTYKQGEVQEI